MNLFGSGVGREELWRAFGKLSAFAQPALRRMRPTSVLEFLEKREFSLPPEGLATALLQYSNSREIDARCFRLLEEVEKNLSVMDVRSLENIWQSSTSPGQDVSCS